MVPNSSTAPDRHPQSGRPAAGLPPFAATAIGSLATLSEAGARRALELLADVAHLARSRYGFDHG